MPRPQGQALHRSLAQLTVGVVRAQQDAQDAMASSQMDEMLQQLQMPIAGYVKDKPISVRTDVYWPHPFVFAPAQRDSDFERPTFSMGVELLADIPVILTGAIVGWHDSVEGYTIGAAIRVTAYIPDARKKQRFNAIFHLTFQGYGAPTDDNTSDTSAGDDQTGVVPGA